MTAKEIKDKMKKDGKYFKISIDMNGNIFSPDEANQFNGLITIYRETITELMSEIKETMNEFNNYGSPYGFRSCKFN